MLVAFHDTDLTRTCGIARFIADLTSDEIGELRVDGRERIPLMSELFERFPDARFNIDCKSDAAVSSLVELVRDHDALDRICIGSFSHARLSKLRALLGSRLLTCMSPNEVGPLRVAGRLAEPPQSCPGARALRSPDGTAWRDDRDTLGSSGRLTGGARRYTSGRSTTQPRCTACSISASTAS